MSHFGRLQDKSEANLDFVITPRRKVKNGSMGCLMGAATVLVGGILHWKLMALWLSSPVPAILMTLDFENYVWLHI